MLYRVATKLVSNNLDWFFKKFLIDHYSRRRQTLVESNKEVQPVPAIDYVLKTCISDEANYPPESIVQWHEYLVKLGSGYSHVFQQLLLLYLQLDISNYLTLRERESTTGRQTRAKDRAELNTLETTLAQLDSISHAFSFTSSTVKLSTGLWALDNDQVNLMVSCLSDPSVNLANYFETPKDLIKNIVGTLYVCCDPRMALYMSKIHRYENEDEDYNSLYAYLLLSSGQLVEALKYERIFVDQENYHEILQRFFELCSKCDVNKAFNRLNLSEHEEEVLNQHFMIESRPVTPANVQTKHVSISASATTMGTASVSKPKLTPRNRSTQVIQRMPSFNDSPAKNTRSARKKKVPG